MKRITAVLLIFILAIAGVFPITVTAEDFSVEGTAAYDGEYTDGFIEESGEDDYTWWYESTGEIEQDRVFINGNPVGVKAPPYFVDSDGMRYQMEELVQYLPIAEALGFSTSFDPETQTITSIREGNTISFQVNGGAIETTRNGVPYTWYIYDIVICDGSTYLPDWMIEYMFDLKRFGYGWGRILDLYEPDVLVKHLQSRIHNLDAYKESIKLPGNYSATYDWNANFDATSNFFGIHLYGKNATHLQVDKKDSVITGDMTSSNEGLFNFYNLIYAAMGNKDSEYFKDKLDLTQPITAKAYFNGDELYVKSDTLVPVGVMDQMSYWLDQQQKDEVSAKIDGNWLKVWINDNAQRTIDTVLDGLSANSGLDTALCEEIVGAVTRQSYDYYWEQEGTMYFDTLSRLDTIADIISQAISVEKSGGQTTAKIKMDHKQLKELVIAMTAAGSHEEQAASVNQILDLMEFDMEQKIVISADGAMKISGNVNAKLTNIPNDFNLDCGSITMYATFIGDVKTTAKPFSKPSEYVDFKTLFEETVQ